MAESILPIAEMLTKLLIEEAAFLQKVEKEVEFLVKELKDTGSDLRKADVMTNREEEFDEWVSQLRDLAFKAEDVTEVFVNNATPYDGCDVFQLIMGCFSQIITLHKLESEINDINNKLNNLPERGSLLTIWSPEDGETSTSHQHDEDLASSRRDEDDDMVGFEKEAKELAFSLKKEEPQGKLLVISIWGQAGAGKTALARNIYKRSDVSSQFDCVAWVSVSPEYEVRDIWQAILKQVKKLTEEEKEQFQKVEDPHGLLDIVHNYLKGKNYLIVLDDLWKQKDWEIISKAFPKSPQKKCRVLLTTRIEEVARVANPSTDPETLRVLNEDESLKLFLKKVFGGSLEDSLSTLSKEMEDVATQMLAKYCEGLPIAIVLLGGILSAKRKDIFEWTEMLRKFRSDLIESRVLRKVFSLSYNELPYLSKPCFLYFGLFPEDSVIECDKLIRLWVAEGFLEQRDNEEMEDVGRECLKGLIQRSMVRVVDRKSNGDPQTCRTHDLVRSFIIQEAKKAKFSNISKKKQLISVVESSRRIALHPEDIDFFHIGTSSAPSESTSVNLSHPLVWLLPSRMRPSFVEGNHDPVGIQDDADQLASYLIKGKPLGKLEVVSIIGTAGIGKTTLARKIYNRSDVKSHFSCRAWINASQGYVVRDLLQTIMQQVTTGLTDAEVVLEEKEEEEEEEELLRKLHKHLEGQESYLIVLDNIWRQEDWDIMERVFPKPLNEQECRVLLTTHDSLVARYINPSGASLLLQTLDKKNSMKLFLQTLFKCSQDQIPSEAALFEEMIEMAGEFLKLSGGLPLLIVLIGGLLSVKRKSVSVWVNLLEIFNQYERGFVFKDLITFCYDDLPGYLRSCFLYLRLFPEDTEIECDALIQLWVVEGFLKRRDNKTMEDVARDCLEEFIKRNLIEVTKRRSNGAPETCRIHGLLRDFAKYESIEARFSKISKDNHLMLVESNRPLVVHPKSSELHGGKSSAIHFQPPKTFSLMNDIISFLEPFKFPNHVYSLICFSKTPQFLRFDQQFPLLRVLDLEGVENMVEVPYEIRNLILLRYLSLRGTRVKLIPSWIAKLHNLQTLDAPGSKIPIDTLKLNQLRHLFAYSFYFSGSSSSSLPLLIDVLEHLQTLELDIGDLEISGLHELTNLRVLRLRRCGGDDNVVRAIAYLKSLKFFSLTQADASSTPMLHLPSLLRHKHLNEMIVEGTITEANDFPPHLTYLWLENSMENGVDPFIPLQKLRFLKKLCLRLFKAQPDAQIQITCPVGGFPELEYLYIRVDFELRNWIVEEGALASLKVLHIDGDATLGELPRGLRYIKTLKELVITRGYDVRDSLMYGRNEWVADLGLSIKYLDESSMRA